MPPLGVGSSDSTTLRTGEAKLWILLVGVNEYQDRSLPSLRYPALDCQGLGEALSSATQGFPNKEVIVHNDFTALAPTLQKIRGSLQKIVSQSHSQDSILLYFSGHGMLDQNTQQAFLCLGDTNKDDLLSTGLGMQELLRILGASPANQQLVCLDTCHSGDIKLWGNRGGRARDATPELPDPTTQMMDVLRQRASQSKGFCALLSCDQGQQSWEFPELGHGVFTYYLMEGLLGGAAESNGLIEADGLYKYVYRQTLQYINKLNQQLRLINQQKLARGDSQLHPEYPLQTPKRILEGVGELIVGFKPDDLSKSHKLRRALVIDGLSSAKTTDLSRLFAGAGGFEVEIFPQKGKSWSEVRGIIQGFTRWQAVSETKTSTVRAIKNTPTSLLYLRGQIEEIEDGEAWLILSDGMRLSRSWLRQELRRAQKIQQIIILDLIISDSDSTSLENWIEDLQCGTEYGQCLIVAVTPAESPERFSQTLLETLVIANPQAGLSVAQWMTQLQTLCRAKGVNLDVWLSGTQAVIDILPGNISTIFQDFQEPEVPDTIKAEETALPKRTALFTPPTPCTLFLSLEQHTKLENLLKRFMGALAPTILQTVVSASANYQELVENLASYILPPQQKQFKQWAMAILETSTVSSQTQPVITSSREPQTIEANFISKCERELARSIGPIANFMIKQVLQSQPQSLPEFVTQLAQKIPEPKQALEFEQRMLGQ